MTKTTEMTVKDVNVEDIIPVSEEALRSFDFTVLPVIKFDGDVFKVSGKDWRFDEKKGFEAVILTADTIWYYRGADDHAIQGFYTEDRERTTKGEPIEDILDMWRRDGVKWVEKEYIQAKIMLTSPEECNKALAIVSISPTSVARFKVYVEVELKLQRGLSPRAVITRFRAADEKVRGSNGKMYSPWQFDFVKPFVK